MSVEKDVLKAERRNKRKLKAGLLLLLMGVSSRAALLASIPTLSRKVQKQIRALHREPNELAREVEEGPKADSPDALLIAATAANLIGALVGSTQVRLTTGTAFPEALEAAVGDVAHRLDRIAVTETWRAYNDQILAATEGKEGTWVWNAVLDKATCAECSGLHGRHFSSAGDVPGIPRHPLCRCHIQFIPG